MSKYVTISVVIEFSDKMVSDDDHNTIAKNVAEAIANEAEHGQGIAPENCDGYTKTIYTKSPITDEEFIVQIN